MFRVAKLKATLCQGTRTRKTIHSPVWDPTYDSHVYSQMLCRCATTTYEITGYRTIGMWRIEYNLSISFNKYIYLKPVKPDIRSLPITYIIISSPEKRGYLNLSKTTNRFWWKLDCCISWNVSRLNKRTKEKITSIYITFSFRKSVVQHEYLGICGTRAWKSYTNIIQSQYHISLTFCFWSRLKGISCHCTYIDIQIKI